MASPVPMSKQLSSQGSQPSSNSPPLTRIQSISFGTLPSRIDTECSNAGTAPKDVVAEHGDESARGRRRSRSPQMSPPMSIRTDMSSTSMTDVDSVFDLAATNKPSRVYGAQRKPATPYPRSPFPWQPRGYPKLATAMAQEPSLAVFRRFGRLNALNLLALQAELAQLEAEYEETLRDDDSSTDPALCTLSSDMTATLQQGQERTTRQYELLLAMRPKLEAYNAALAATAGVDNLPKPAQGSVDSLRGWLAAPECGNDFLERNSTSDAEAMTYDSTYDDDLVALGDGGASNSSTTNVDSTSAPRQSSNLITPNLLAWLHKHVTARLEPLLNPPAPSSSPSQPPTTITSCNSVTSLLSMNEKATAATTNNNSSSSLGASNNCYFTSNSSSSSIPQLATFANTTTTTTSSTSPQSNPNSNKIPTRPASWSTQRAALQNQRQRLQAWSQAYTLLLVLAASLLPIFVAALTLLSVQSSAATSPLALMLRGSMVLTTATAGFGILAATATTMAVEHVFVATLGFALASMLMVVGGSVVGA